LNKEVEAKIEKLIGELYRELAEGQSPKVMFNLLVYNQ
jgi:hypothetical protein